jgi:hypothetical protein
LWNFARCEDQRRGGRLRRNENVDLVAMGMAPFPRLGREGGFEICSRSLGFWVLAKRVLGNLKHCLRMCAKREVGWECGVVLNWDTPRSRDEELGSSGISASRVVPRSRGGATFGRYGSGALD